MKAAFLDRDGTIISDYTDKQWSNVKEPEFLPGSISGLRGIQELGFVLIIVTNQYLIGENFVTIEDYKTFTHRFINVLARNKIKVLDIFYCPHRRDSDCQCMKPRPGLIQQALNEYPDISLTDSFLVGDSETDIKLAEFFGIRSFSLGFPYSRENNIQIDALDEIPNYYN